MTATTKLVTPRTYWDTEHGREELDQINRAIDRLTFDALPADHRPREPRRLKFRRITVGVDGSGPSEFALDWAIEVARVYRSYVDVVTVVGPLGAYEHYGPNAAGWVESEEVIGRRALNEGVERLQTSGIDVAGTLRHGSPATEIVRFAEANDSDLIIVGSHGRRSVERFLLGSTAEGVKNEATTHVLIARTPAPAHTILVPTDGSVPSREAALVARDLREAWHASARMLHVVAPPPFSPMENARRAFRAKLRKEDWRPTNGLGIAADIEVGPAADTIVRHARRSGAELIVMGSRGLSGVRNWLLGTVSGPVVHRTRSSVLLIKDPR